MSARGAAPIVLLAAVTGAAAGWLAGATSGRGELLTPNADSQVIVDELRRLGAELRALAARPAAPPPSALSQTSERTDAAPSPTTTASTDERLLTAIEQLVVRVEQIATRQIADNGTLQRLAAERAPDTQALGELLRHIDDDWNGAQHELFLMPMAAVLQRFGAPTYVNASGASPVWVYEFHVDDDRRTVTITFHDGVVIQVG
ncbi:MAG: hypothetical protein H6835_05680 [Planctomycetes bacterium]|nr:hypothetical protein [Planctomycetota bacterium]